MIQVGRFEPGNVGRDLEKMFENGQRAADEHRGHNAVADRERALDSDHRPVGRPGIEEIDWTDQPKGQRKQPDREADAKSGADQPAAAPHLQRQVDGGEPLINPITSNGASILSEQDAAPETNEDRAVKPVVAPEQDAKHERRKSIGRDQATPSPVEES